MKKLKEIWANRKVRFTVVSVIYILWFVVWTQNLWWLLGLVLIYDYYFSRFIDKIFLNKYRAYKKKCNKGIKVTLEWCEALLYAMIVVIPLKLYFFGLYVIPSSSMEGSLLIGDYLFVNKLEYGPRMPNTPLSFPFVQHTLPFTENTKSWIDWPTFEYKRLKGFSKIERDDVIVFNFPAGDTVALAYPNATYYDLVREYGRKEVHAMSKVVYRPVDKRENYIKRCVAIAGDSLHVINGVLYVNGVKQKEIEGLQTTYMVRTNGSVLGSKFFEDLEVREKEVAYDKVSHVYHMPLSIKQVQKASKYSEIVEITRATYDKEIVESDAFPHSPEKYPWNRDQYGPIWIPKAGITVDLNLDNLPLYERIIKNYENNNLQVSDSVIMINGVKADKYTFKMDYYFMMGDNRHQSADSRFWGFVPVDHIEGKASFVWMSIIPEKNIFTGIRWKRLFRGIN